MNITQDAIDINDIGSLYTVEYAGLRVYVVARNALEAEHKFMTKKWVGISPMSTVNEKHLGLVEKV
jgi:hypothetical protein